MTIHPRVVTREDMEDRLHELDARYMDGNLSVEEQIEMNELMAELTYIEGGVVNVDP